MQYRKNAGEDCRNVWGDRQRPILVSKETYKNAGEDCRNVWGDRQRHACDTSLCVWGDRQRHACDTSLLYPVTMTS